MTASHGKNLLYFIIALSLGMAFLANMFIPQLVTYTTSLGDVTDAGTLAMLTMVGIGAGAGIIIVILKGAGLF